MEETVGCGSGFLERIRETFACREQDIRTYSPLTLAYIGDGVYELVIRSVIVERGNRPVNALHRAATGYVRAQTQAKLIRELQDELTEEELAVYRRGRNAKPYTKAKNATMSDYLMATGFEAVMGYLYLTGQNERMLQLIRTGIERVGLEL